MINVNKEIRDLEIYDNQSGKKIIYIIYDKKDIKAAEVARNLISGKKGIKCSLIEQKVLYSNYKISSNNILIYIGNIQNTYESRKLSERARLKRDYGIHYGWNGRQAFIWTENHNLGNDKKSFIKEYEKEFGRMKHSYSRKKCLIYAAVLLTGLIVAPGLAGVGAGLIGCGCDAIISEEFLIPKEAVMSLAVMKFMNDEVDSFIEQALKGV